MSKIKIMTDSASDISLEAEIEHDIAVIGFPVSLGSKSYISRQDFDEEGFYELMKGSEDIPKTSQITPFQFVEIYLEQASAGITDLVLVLINSNGSSTYMNSIQAVELFYEDYPQYRDSFRVHSFDGMGYNAIYGEPAIEAAQMLEEGKSLEDICGYLTEILPRRQLYFGIYDLKYAARSGRIPTAAAFLGNKLNLKPVMKIFGGEINTAAKCRGEKNLVAKVAELSVSEMEQGSPYQLVYGSDEQVLEQIRSLMEEKLGYGPSRCYRIGAAVAANAGHRVVGVCFTRRGE